MKKKMIAAMTALAMVTSTGSVVFADETVDYDVENHEFKDVTITLHTRWDEADISLSGYCGWFYGKISWDYC